MTFPRRTAVKRLQEIKNALAPYCNRLESVGELRMGYPTVTSIEFVALASDPHGLAKRIGRNSELLNEGNASVRAELPGGLPLRVWLADAPSRELFSGRPGNFGALMLMRTATPLFIKDFSAYAVDRGYVFESSTGLLRFGVPTAGNEESDIFLCLNLPFIQPEQRLQFHPSQRFEEGVPW